MSGPTIKGKFQSATDVGNYGNGNKTELNLGISFIPELKLNLHSELKTGLWEQDKFDGEDLKPQDLLVKGIYGDRMAFPIVKAINLEGKIVPVLTLGFGIKDVGRDITSNGAKTVGAGDIAEFSRASTIPFFERLLHIFPGPTLSGYAEYADKNEKASWRLFAAAGSGKNRPGLLGIEQKKL